MVWNILEFKYVITWSRWWGIERTANYIFWTTYEKSRTLAENMKLHKKKQSLLAELGKHIKE